LLWLKQQSSGRAFDSTLLGFRNLRFRFLRQQPLDRRILEVLFHGGSVYQYFDVPPQIYNELRQASSVGQYINANIKGHFRYARV
jgi:hypothetical protein